MRCSLAVLVLAGCFSKPPPPCTKAKSLAFTVEADDCSPWGIAQGNATFHQGGGVLTIAPGQNTSAACFSEPTSETPFGEGGVFVEVEPEQTPFTTTAFSVGEPGSFNPQISVQDGMITFDERFNPNARFATTRPYDHDAMHWWRLVPDLVTYAVIAQVSPDGVTWSELARAENTDLPGEDQMLSSVGFEFDITAGNTPGHAEFRNVDICTD